MADRSNLEITFKSGAKVVFDAVEDWTAKSQSGEIVGITVKQNDRCKRRLIVHSLRLDSIDVITEF